MAFRDQVLDLLRIINAATGKDAAVIEAGPDSQGVGQAVIKLSTGDAGELYPAEITAYVASGQDALILNSPGILADATKGRAEIILYGGLNQPSGQNDKAVIQVIADSIALLGTGAAGISSEVTVSVTTLTLSPSTYAITGGTVDTDTYAGYALPARHPLPFNNSWTNYGGSQAPGTYRKEPGPYVCLEGLVKNATLTQTGTLATLPAGYYPTENHIFLVLANGGSARIDVLNTGVVSLDSYQGGNAGFVSLSGVRFPVD